MQTIEKNQDKLFHGLGIQRIMLETISRIPTMFWFSSAFFFRGMLMFISDQR